MMRPRLGSILGRQGRLRKLRDQMAGVDVPIRPFWAASRQCGPLQAAGSSGMAM